MRSLFIGLSIVLIASAAFTDHLFEAFGTEFAKGMSEAEVRRRLPERYVLRDGPSPRYLGVVDQRSKKSVGALTFDADGGLAKVSAELGRFTGRDAENLIRALFSAASADTSAREGTIKIHPATGPGQVAEITFGEKSLVVTRFEQPQRSGAAIHIVETITLK